MSQLDVLYPAGKEVTAGGETITVKKIKFGKIPEASRLIVPISKQIAAVFRPDDSRTVFDMGALFVELMANGGDALIVALGFFINKPREWFDGIENDEGLELLKAVYEVNADFFRRRILPLFTQAVAETPSNGVTLSESLSEQGTAEPTSTTTP